MGNFSLTTGLGYRLMVEPQFLAVPEVSLNATGFFDLADRVPPYSTDRQNLGNANPRHKSGYLHQWYAGGAFAFNPALFTAGEAAPNATNYSVTARTGYALSSCFRTNPEQVYSPDSSTHNNTRSCRWTASIGVRTDIIFPDDPRLLLGFEGRGDVTLGRYDPNAFSLGIFVSSQWNLFNLGHTHETVVGVNLGIRN